MSRVPGIPKNRPRRGALASELVKERHQVQPYQDDLLHSSVGQDMIPSGLTVTHSDSVSESCDGKPGSCIELLFKVCDRGPIALHGAYRPALFTDCNDDLVQPLFRP